MNVKSFHKLATVSALALGAVLCANNSHAASILSGTPTTVPIHATILNTFTVTTTTLNLGQVGVTPKAANQASITLLPSATLLAPAVTGGGVNTNARIAVDSTSAAAPTVVTVVGFASTQVKVDYTLCVSPTDGTSTFILTDLADNLGGGLPVGTAGTNGHGCTGPTQGNAVTDGTGNLTFDVGATIKTSATNTAYADGTYNGSFDITLSY